MAMKRLSSDWEDGDGTEVPRQESKRRLAFAGGVRDASKGLSMQEFVIKLEPFFRNRVREELKRKILLFSHPSPISSHARNLQLHFVDKLPPTLFTGRRIKSEHNKPVKIVIIDAFSKNLVTSLPLPSIRVEIVVLDGDFGPQEDWTEKEFDTKVVREREGIRPLVIGELVVTLRGGVGYVSDVSFTDNSKWTRSGKVRLGARTVPSISPELSPSFSTELRMREAKSNAFVVKDPRGESYEKHSRPNLNDEIWRLTKIAKGGKFHERLASKGIETVKDFLRFYYVDRSSLRNILGAGGGVSSKTWETITKNATACFLDKQYYMYSRDAGMVGLVLNSVWKVVGAVFEGQNYEMDKLNPFQKGVVENLKRCAYKNLGDLVPINEPPVFGLGMVPASLQPVNLGPGMVPARLPPVNFPGVHQDQQNMLLEQPSHPMQFLPLTVSVEQHSHPMQYLPPTPTHNLMSMNSYPGPCGEGNSWARGGCLGPLMQLGNQTADDSFQIETPFWGAKGLLNDFLSSGFGFDISRNGKPKLRWAIIRAVMKFVISFRRDVAAKKCLDFLPESLGPLMQIGNQTADDSFQIETPIRPSNEAVEFLSSDFGFDKSRNGKPKLRWAIIRAVMKFVISFRRDVAAQKCLDFLPEVLDC